MPEQLTARQQEVLDFIKSRVSIDGFPPSVREIMQRLEIKSPNGVCCHLAALERKGYIERSGGMARAIKLMDLDHNCCHACGRPFEGN